MPSVYATWTGSCRDAARRRELLGHVEQIAAVSHGYLGDPPLVRHDGALAGRVLLSTDLFDAAPAGARATPVSDRLLALDRARIEGIEFRLYDGRGLYPGEDRVSFAFLVDADPALDGRLVYVEDQQECRKYTDPLVQAADWYLAVPNIHLRYYLEEWLDLLMAWVKHYFIPDLHYWRHEPRLEDERLPRETFGDLAAGDVLPVLIEQFRAEVGDWRGLAEQARELYARVGRPTALHLPPAGAPDAEVESAVADALRRAVRVTLDDAPVEPAPADPWGRPPSDERPAPPGG